MTSASLARLIAQTLADGGGTFAPRTLRPVTKGGYAVGYHSGTYRTVPQNAPIGAIVYAVLECTRDYSSAYIGTWLDSGTIHIDPVRLWPTRSMALGYAWGQRQLAIYHLDSGATLYLGERLGEYIEED